VHNLSELVDVLDHVHQNINHDQHKDDNKKEYENDLMMVIEIVH
jgi:hypothetical protein